MIENGMINMNVELKIDDNIVLEIKRLGINGEGIGYYKKLAVFVNNTIPGDEVKVKIISVSPKMAFAEVIDYRKKSEAHVEFPCPYYEECGGCQTMHIKYETMGQFKRDMVIEALYRYTDINPKTFEIKKTVIMDNPYGYRNKSSLPVRKFNDKTVVGLINPISKKVIYIENCLVQNPIVNAVNNKILHLVDEAGISAFVEYYNRGILRYIVTRVSTLNNEVQVTLVLNEKSAKIFDLAKKIIQIPEVVSVYESFNDTKKEGAGIFGSELKLLQGKECITEKIGEYKFDLKPNAFYQLNPVQTIRLYDEVKKACKLSRQEVVLDAYCGVGTIGLYLSKMAKKVIGIEYNKEAVENAIENAKNNKVTNVNFYQGDVTEVLPGLLNNGLNIDVVVVDPPRTGLTPELIETFLELKAKRFVYVSCNPSTLAKDLNKLTTIYNIKYIQPVDMFPLTSHVESVCLMTRKE